MSTKSTSSKSSQELKQAAMQELPLDWTRVKRQRRAECKIEYNPRTLSKESPLVVGNNERKHDGCAIFCLHDSSDPTWFQGYFLQSAALGDSINSEIIQSSGQPWGLLATKEEIDECLECENGGYRRITLKVFHASPSSSIDSTSLSGIDWTGGDMMRLSNEKVEMNTLRLLTGKDALPSLKQYFTSLIRKLKQACKGDEDEKFGDKNESEETEILELLPDLAVLVGRISMILPRDVGGGGQPKKGSASKNSKAIPATGKQGKDLWDD